MPTTIPSTVACAKIRIATPINAATIQSALMGAFSHRLTPLRGVYFFWVGPRPPLDGINMRLVGLKRWSIIRSDRTREKYPFIGTVCEEAVDSPSNRGGAMTTLMDTARIEAPRDRR
jgi:hypothetical protein